MSTVPGLFQMKPVARMGRRTRKPSHTFHIRQRPYQLQPFMIAPVLPGETMKNLLVQARCVTDPIKNGLIGWWAEMYFFYVKNRDLSIREDMTEMHINPAKDMSSHFTSASVPFYHFGGTINYAKLALERIVDEYFRNEGEDHTDYLLDTIPMAMAIQNGTHWTDSAVLETQLEIPDVEVDQNADDVITASEVHQAMIQWQTLMSAGLTEQTYEEFLRTYGVRAPKEERHRPELIRYIREWTYPTNTVDPSTGNPSSAAVWSIAERADKDRMFKEPGFIIGISTFRPKVYLSKQVGSAAGLLIDALAWLPAVLRDDPFTSLKLVPHGAGPLPEVEDGDELGYYVDVKDLLEHGDQFVNFALSETNANLVALPTVALQKRYASSADIDALFAAASPANKVKMDGVCNLQIATSEHDHTRST